MTYKPALYAAVFALGTALAGAGLVLGTTTAPPAHAAVTTGAFPTNSAGEPTLAPVIAKVAPAIVNIATSGVVKSPGMQNPEFNNPLFRQLFPNFPFPNQGVEHIHAVGSGVIVDAKNGYILTNNHVIKGANKIMVTLTDKRQFRAKLVGTDPKTDIAVLKIDAKNLTAATFGNSSKLQVGDFVVAIGDPFGLGQTSTLGIVSALGRSGLGIEDYADFIQTDASINPGNSGGALIDLSGHVVGINTAILGRHGNIGIGFAIPSSMAENVMHQIIQYGSVHRGLLGVNIQDMTPALAQAMGVKVDHGALVSRVMPDTAAKAAGIQDGDVVIGINGQPVNNAADLRDAVGLLRVGQTAKLEIERDGHKMTISAVIRANPHQQQTASSGQQNNSQQQPTIPGAVAFAGAQFGPINANASVSGPVKGVQIVQISPSGKAQDAGLRKGDVVTEVDRTPVATPKEFKEAVSNAKGQVLLHVRRGEAAFYVLL